jgi:hypothetical protein
LAQGLRREQEPIEENGDMSQFSGLVGNAYASHYFGEFQLLASASTSGDSRKSLHPNKMVPQFSRLGRRAVAKQPFEFTAELGRAFITDFQRRSTRIGPQYSHQSRP